jgi:hypothetical protein
MLHVSNIIKKSKKSVHDSLADPASILAVVNIELVAYNAFVAAKKFSLRMEEIP